MLYPFELRALAKLGSFYCIGLIGRPQILSMAPNVCDIIVAFPRPRRRVLEDTHMRSKILVFLLVLLARLAAPQDSLRVYYVNGEALEQITDHDITVSLNDEDKKNWLTVYVVNDSNDAVNVIPTGLRFIRPHQRTRISRLKTERDLKRAVGHGVFWGQVIAGVGAGLSRNISSATTRTAYGSVRTVVNTPDYEAQARWLA
jgi:hypothetical protein